MRVEMVGELEKRRDREVGHEEGRVAEERGYREIERGDVGV